MLPKHTFPTYKITLPISKKEVKFRPWVSVESKKMMTARLTKDTDSILDSIVEVLGSCIFDEFALGYHIPMADLLYLFIQVKMKSKDEVISLNYKATLEEDGVSEIIPIDLNLNEVAITETPEKKIMITDSYGIMMKYPTLVEARQIDDQTDDYYKLAILIDYVFDAEKVYDKDSYTFEELTEWIKQMPDTAMEKLVNFYENLPTIYIKVDGIGPKQKTLMIIGLNDFLF